MQRTLAIGWLKYFSVFLIGCNMLTTSAWSDPAYERWKQRQEQHDLRLQTKQYAIGGEKSDNKHDTIANKNVYQQIYPSLSAVATSSLAEQQAITQVLGSSVKVNINQASVQELSAKLESIGTKKAQAIVDYRNKHGGFKHLEELKNVKGIGDKIYQRNRERLTLHHE